MQIIADGEKEGFKRWVLTSGNTAISRSQQPRKSQKDHLSLVLWNENLTCLVRKKYYREQKFKVPAVLENNMFLNRRLKAKIKVWKVARGLLKGLVCKCLDLTLSEILSSICVIKPLLAFIAFISFILID